MPGVILADLPAASVDHVAREFELQWNVLSVGSSDRRRRCRQPLRESLIGEERGEQSSVVRLRQARRGPAQRVEPRVAIRSFDPNGVEAARPVLEAVPFPPQSIRKVRAEDLETLLSRPLEQNAVGGAAPRSHLIADASI